MRGKALLIALVSLLALTGTAEAQRRKRKRKRTRPPSLKRLKARYAKTFGKPLADQLGAIRAFGQLKTQACVEALREIHRLEQKAVLKLEALRTIGRVGVDPARATLEEFLSKGAEAERPAALDGLAYIRPLVPPKPFLEVLRAHTLPMRLAAARALANYGQAEVALALGKVLEDEATMRSLRREATRALKAVVAREPADAWLVEKALALESPPLPKILPELLRIASVCSHSKARPAVRAHTKNSDSKARAAAADALGELAEGLGPRAEADLDALAPLLRDKETSVALSAGLAVGRIGPVGKALAAVLKLCKSRHPGLRAVGVSALARSEDPRAKKVVLKAIKDKAFPVRAAAIRSLAKMRDKQAVSALIGALKKNKSGRLNADILTALRTLTGANPGQKHKHWKRWWNKVKDDYDLGSVKASAKKPAAGSSKARGVPTYYGSEVVSKRLTFIVDVSGSMRAKVKDKEGLERTRLAVCKRELQSVIRRLSRKTRFNVVWFHGKFKPWSKRIAPAGKKQKASALEFVNKLRARGGTNIYDPLEAALLDPEVDTIYLLSDGAPGSGKFVAVPDILREVRKLNAARQITIHTISIGRGSELMKKLAQQNGGAAIVR